jgi:hypothetical protein
MAAEAFIFSALFSSMVRTCCGNGCARSSAGDHYLADVMAPLKILMGLLCLVETESSIDHRLQMMRIDSAIRRLEASAADYRDSLDGKQTSGEYARDVSAPTKAPTSESRPSNAVDLIERSKVCGPTEKKRGGLRESSDRDHSTTSLEYEP